MSIRWWRTQHPSPVFGDGGSIASVFLPALLWNFVAWAMWGAFILGVRYAVERRRQRQAAAYALSFMSDPEPAPARHAPAHALETR
jgi:heme exporter protein C